MHLRVEPRTRLPLRAYGPRRAWCILVRRKPCTRRSGSQPASFHLFSSTRRTFSRIKYEHSSVTFCTNKVSVCHQLESFLFLHLIVQTGNSFLDTDLYLYSKYR
jgi:hypothetical protein